MLDFLIKLGKKNKKIKSLSQKLSFSFHVSARVISSARPYSISLLAKITNKPVIVIAINETRACELSAEINHFLPAKHIPSTKESDTPQTKNKYLNGLNSLKRGDAIVCLGSEMLTEKILSPKKVLKSFSLKINQEFKLTNLAKKLVSLGYSRQYQVDSPAQFSIRGNICDIYPPLKRFPVRIEFFSDTIEEIRNFDPFNQRSHNSLSSISIEACSFQGKPSSELKDYLNNKHLFIFEDFSLVKNKCGCDLSFTENNPILNLTLLSRETQKEDLGFEKIEFSAGQFEKIHNFLKEQQNQGYLTVINIQEEGKRARFKELLKNWRFFSEEFRKDIAILRPSILLTTHKVENSFVWPEEKIAVLSDKDIFIRQLPKLPPKLHSGHVKISSFEDLKPDDYVVHINHGIAKYKGLETREIDNIKREYLLLSYAGNDKLLVPVSEMDRVTRYIGAGKKEPQISRLDSNKWNLTKKRVKKSVRKLAVNLLDLYARRNQAKGFKFSKDTPWQQQLENDFPFEETEGQISAIDEAKHDLEQDKPMDRLICGDVGYGKTEVALRAAFKVVQDSKQVLFLVPTTILAQQHYKTFISRLSPYPVIIQVLSRFKSKFEQQSIVNDFNQGKVDILIGTHRLLQKDIKPKALGLIVIDEEQRFGVNHKERLKMLKTEVDILTLSATPIPRTLQMALSGIRDLSVIETPPDNRHPVTTHVGPYKTELAVKSIKKELNRGGQVFYLHNKVQSINSVANKLLSLIPEARIAIAHGQLKEKQLEKVMLDFLENKIDVLVTTTIIESGIDIANANTLIVDNADSFGLSQLYQIRGRVGRSQEKAFAYFFYRRHLTDNAVERLKTLANFSSLGSGYKISLRDLEIRGAGNILGAEQSGYVASVGFDLYTHLLKKAIEELRGEKPKDKLKNTDLPISAYIPKNYIAQESIRIEFYQRLANAKTKSKFKFILKEMADRFGSLPKQVKNLKSIGLLKFK